MDGEKVVEHFSLFDRLSLMQQLNPPPAEWAGGGVSTLLHPSEATGKGARRAGGGWQIRPKSPRGLVRRSITSSGEGGI